MMTWVILTGVCLACVAVLGLLRWRDLRADNDEALRLQAFQPAPPRRFDPAMVADLPDPARKFFLWAIEPGAELFTVAALEMQGKFGMGDKARPGYMPMTARQTLASPHGFVWAMRAGQGLRRMSGSDSAGWTRFWLAGLVPVARFGGTQDHRRSAFGRYAAEAVMWTPAAVLPQPGITWQGIDAETARVIIAHDGMEQAIEMTVDAEGAPKKIVFERWSNANPERQWRLQPFGAILSAPQSFAGIRIPTHVEAGNHFGTDAFFPFFIVDVTDLRFPQAART
ncbi:hypothetical protein SPO3605 [Ruegeria pomeroyi DSS-3]|uniref:Uncharacterized protein n=2 Tax=Ruegeria pomeroyi TaxID=89184 RepID=Q5LMF8_RUEPO|nr:DUF6544 family protein [Ruegeria pomeroyi]AAV96829.1 hypothetical protein SPO3605 [Ruegeria pomeroyi DSS-3]